MAVYFMNGSTVVESGLCSEKNGRYCFSKSVNGEFNILRIGHSGATNDEYAKFDIGTTSSGDYTVSVEVVGKNPSVVGGFSFKNIQLEKGLQATSYKPYIPSVKMLADENKKQSTEIMDIKMFGWSVPKECPVQNYVDPDGVFHQRVGRVDLGSLNWQYESNRFVTVLPDKFKPSNPNEWTRGLYCVLYEANPSPVVNDNVNMTISGYTDDIHLYLYNFSYTDATTFKNAMQGVYLYYELETPITKTIDGNEAVTQIKNDLFDVKANMSHNIPRTIPKDITSYYNDGSIWKRLNGTDGFSKYEDIFVGDYFKMSRAISAYNQDQNYQLTGSDCVTIAGISTLLGNGDTVINYEHLVMVPGKGFGGTQHFGRSRMNPTHTTVGGYVGSEMHTTTIGEVVSSGSTATTATINQQLYAEFGSHLKTTRELLSNSLNSTGYNRFGEAGGCSNNWGWYDCQAVLMSEIELYGSIVWSSSGYDTGTAKMQLPLFANNRQAMNNRSSWYWLKDVASASFFCYCSGDGYADYGSAGGANGCVRPRFVIAA